MSKLIKLYTFNMCCVLCVTYTSIKLLKKYSCSSFKTSPKPYSFLPHSPFTCTCYRFADGPHLPSSQYVSSQGSSSWLRPSIQLATWRIHMWAYIPPDQIITSHLALLLCSLWHGMCLLSKFKTQAPFYSLLSWEIVSFSYTVSMSRRPLLPETFPGPSRLSWWRPCIPGMDLLIPGCPDWGELQGTRVQNGFGSRASSVGGPW